MHTFYALSKCVKHFPTILCPRILVMNLLFAYSAYKVSVDKGDVFHHKVPMWDKIPHHIRVIHSSQDLKKSRFLQKYRIHWG